MTHVYQPLSGGSAYFTSGLINGSMAVGGTWTAYSTLTLPAYTLGGTVTSNGQSFSGTIANLGTVTTVDINGGTIDGVALGGASAVSLGTPSSGTLTNCTGLPVSTGIAGLGTGVATFLATPSSANLASAVTDETGTGALVFANSPVFTTPNIGSATGSISGNAATVTTNANLTGPITSVGNATSVAAQTGTGSTFVMQASPSLTTPTINTAAAVGGAWTAAAAWTLPALTLGGTVTSNGQSFSGTIANLGTVTTADINGGTIDGTVIGGATPAAGTFTDLTSSGNTVLGNASTDTLNVGNGGIIKDASGNVGIGVTPGKRLDVLTSGRMRYESGLGAGFWLNSSTTTDRCFIGTDNGTDHFRIYGAGAGAAVMVNLGNGNVGIGVTPSYALHLNSGQFAGPDGTAGAPTYSFASSGNADNGMYLSAENVLSFAIAGTKTATIQADRLEFAAGYHVASATATGTTPAIQSGTYTPTITGVSNFTSGTANAYTMWYRIGNIVTVVGRVTVQLSGTTSSSFRISLPISSNFTDTRQLLGDWAWQVSSPPIVGTLSGDTTNDAALFSIYHGVGSGAEIEADFRFSYEVL